MVPIRRLAGRVGLVLGFALLVSVGGQAWGVNAFEGCPEESDEQATILGLTINGTDLSVDMVLAPGVSSVSLTLSDSNGDFVQSTTKPLPILRAAKKGLVPTILPVSPLPTPTPPTVTKPTRTTVVMPGAFTSALTRNVGYWLTATDSTGSPLMPSYPFSIYIECPPGLSCKFFPEPGLLTSALWVTTELWAEIEANADCNLVPFLLEIVKKGRGSDLARDAETLMHQLKMNGITGASTACAFAWMAVAPRGQGEWEEEPPTGQESVWEFGGGKAGASLCYNAQAGDYLGAAAFFERNGLEGESRLDQRIRCVQGTASCAGGCSGLVTPTFTYRGCANGEADVYAAGGSSEGVATQLEVELLINDEQAYFVSGEAVRFDHVGAAARTTVPECRKAPRSLSADALEVQSHVTPARHTVAAEAGLAVSVPETGQVNPCQGGACGGLVQCPETPPAGYTGWAWSEVVDFFALELSGVPLPSPQPACSAIGPVYSAIATPDPLVLSGGSKIERWRDGPGGG